ncbi:hypothetical protein [Methylobacterium sp. J-076]|uniref:hypothetical protein n=1 Tax=Methylobacterium sp. J-076 TaxID=2836655 RepID=UPI001FBBF23B|nr:hypothetical protein [Methylobacterium sp. J-076]MCJ2011089.1 hypothetical protein [Methylobacterium sp. J-076]
MNPAFPAFLTLICTLVAAGIVTFVTPVPAFVPFPDLDPDPLPADISAAVAYARDRQLEAEKAQDWAEQVAAVQGKEAARLLIENNTMRARLKSADTKIKALEELKLPAAIELVAKMSDTGQGGDSGGDGDGSESASSDYTPKGPSRRS